MKVGAIDLDKPAGELVVIPRGDQPELRLYVTAPPIGKGGAEFTLFPDPPVPEEYARDPKGGVLFDSDKRPVVMKKKDDPAYLAAMEKAGRRRIAYQFALALENDTNVSFRADTNPGRPTRTDDAKAWAAFCDVLLEELDRANIPLGTIRIVVDKSIALACPTPAELAAARDRFFNRVEVGSFPSLQPTMTAETSTT